jgi:hypothetical protein
MSSRAILFEGLPAAMSGFQMSMISRPTAIKTFHSLRMSETVMLKVLLVQGANANYLGKREPAIYGTTAGSL